jgi:hypothetical protein
VTGYRGASEFPDLAELNHDLERLTSSSDLRHQASLSYLRFLYYPSCDRRIHEEARLKLGISEQRITPKAFDSRNFATGIPGGIENLEPIHSAI